MGAGQRGFTLIETVVTVGITVILLVAGGVWLLGMRPGALRNAADDFDAQLAAARAIAASSGNGATIVFAPRTGTVGFIMRVYSGRPNASGAVKSTNVMEVTSGASVSEATFGAPPFAIFLSSAGYPTGSARYPHVASDGTIAFPVVATQPPCPAGGIVLTFANAQGATAKRTLRCNSALVAGTAVANPSPTPNAPKLTPSFMLAHWTTDAGPLHFIAAEYGYYHWYASLAGSTCQTQSSDTGAAPATYANGWPYSLTTPSEMAAAPAIPNAPYSWPTGDPNDPPAKFVLSPVAHNAGLCTVRVVDDYGQEADASVQVMGDLQGSASSLTFNAPTDPAQIVTFGKTFDSEALMMQAAASACAGVVSMSIPAPPTPQSSPSTIPTQATIVVTPVAAGSCVLLVGDQYGEPTLSIPINVKAPTGPLQTLSQIEFSSAAVGGAGASATGTTCGYAQLWWYDVNGNSVLDANGADGVNATDANGCLATGPVYLATTESGYSGRFSQQAMCSAYATVSQTNWLVGSQPPSVTPVASTAGCTFPVYSSDKPLGGGSRNVTVIVDSGCSASGGSVAIGQSCSFTTTSKFAVCDGYVIPASEEYSDDFASWSSAIATGSSIGSPPLSDPMGGGSYAESGPLGTLTSTEDYDNPGGNPSSSWTTITFTRTGNGPATFYLYSDDVQETGHAIIAGDPVCYSKYTLSGPTAITVN